MSAVSRLRTRLNLRSLIPPRWRRGKSTSAERGEAASEQAVDLDEVPRGKARVAQIAGFAATAVLGAAVLWWSFSARDAAEPAVEEAAPPLDGPHVVVPVQDRRPPPPKPALADVNLPDARVDLPPAPAEGLVEPGPSGPLPRVADDGRSPWQTYARPFVQDDPRPRIVLVVAEMGISTSATEAAIRQLPGAVTLAFPAGAPQIQPLVDKARADGHEVLLDLPMEPQGYPADDPGPNTLLTGLGPEQNHERLLWALSRTTGYVGVTSLSGSRFTTQPDALRPIAREIGRRGLLVLDSRAAPRSVAGALATELGVPRAIGDGLLDAVPSAAAIDSELRALEEIARRRSAAVGIVGAYPLTLRRIADWIPTLRDKGLVLAPVSAAVNRQPDR